MSTLHTVNKSPFERNSLAACLAHVSKGDAVLMIEDGVLGARKNSSFAKTLDQAMGNCTVYVLGPDLAARGVKADDVMDGVKVVDYGGFVDLVAEHKRTHAWL